MLQGNHTLHKESEKFQTGVRKGNRFQHGDVGTTGKDF